MASLINFMLNPAAALLPILVTEHFGGGVMHLASVDSTFGIGIVIGGIAMGAWGGFKRRVHGVLIGWALSSLLGQVVIGLGRGPWLWIPGAFGWLVGTGPGAGMALLIIVTGLMAMTVGVSGYLFPAVRNAEDILPDHDAGSRMESALTVA